MRKDHLTPRSGGMEQARDLAEKCATKDRDLFSINSPTPIIHWPIIKDGPEIWRDTNGTITHFVSSMGTTELSWMLKVFQRAIKPVRVIGVQPEEGAQIPGIRNGHRPIYPKF